jgi:DNA-binding response OmpR family regulator
MAKVLIAEDDPTMRTLLETLLSMEGFQVAVLEPDEDVLNAVRHEPPGLLLLDVNLSGQSGLEVLSQIRRDATIKKLPIVMTSGMDLKIECMHEGADDFLLKPYTPNDLISTIKRHVNPKAKPG